MPSPPLGTINIENYIKIKLEKKKVPKNDWMRKHADINSTPVHLFGHIFGSRGFSALRSVK